MPYPISNYDSRGDTFLLVASGVDPRDDLPPLPRDFPEPDLAEEGRLAMSDGLSVRSLEDMNESASGLYAARRRDFNAGIAICQP